MITNIRMVIDIPKYVYDTCKDLSLVADADIEKVGKAIANGTLLPKGHGRTIILSEDAVKREQRPLSFSCQKWISEIGLSNATLAIIEADKAGSRLGLPRWIPVSEMLPKENETVVASTDDEVYPEAKYTKEGGWKWAYEAGSDYWVELKGVTAWIPLPEPYKDESGDAE